MRIEKVVPVYLSVYTLMFTTTENILIKFSIEKSRVKFVRQTSFGLFQTSITCSLCATQVKLNVNFRCWII